MNIGSMKVQATLLFIFAIASGAFHDNGYNGIAFSLGVMALICIMALLLGYLGGHHLSKEDRLG